jgi:integrase
MINRQNWLDIRAYLDHLETRLGRDPQTVHKYGNYLRHLIEWADESPLPLAYRKTEPVFPLYLASARNDGGSKPLSYTTLYKALTTTRQFFAFARDRWSRYHSISNAWLDTLLPHSKPEPTLDEHRFYTLDEVRALLAVSAETLRDQRARTAAAMLFLSGMRPDSLASAPRRCIDLPQRRVLQLPSLGIRTKNRKAGITYLLDIPDLIDVVRAWDRKVGHMAPTALWYATLDPGGTCLHETERAIRGRASVIGDDLRPLCQRAGVEYKSPHKFRHGHIVYARGLARNMDEVKAISQNVMHANIIITDQVYSGLKTDQVQTTIASLGKQKEADTAELLRLLDALRAQIT